MSIPKEELHRLVDALPERETIVVKRFLELLLTTNTDDSWIEFLKNPPETDESLDEEDLKAIKEAEKAIAEGKVQPWEEVKKELQRNGRQCIKRNNPEVH